jgi:hypothetical protein
MELLVLYVLKNMLEILAEELGHDYEDLVEGSCSKIWCLCPPG